MAKHSKGMIVSSGTHQVGPTPSDTWVRMNPEFAHDAQFLIEEEKGPVDAHDWCNGFTFGDGDPDYHFAKVVKAKKQSPAEETDISSRYEEMEERFWARQMELFEEDRADTSDKVPPELEHLTELPKTEKGKYRVRRLLKAGVDLEEHYRRITEWKRYRKTQYRRV